MAVRKLMPGERTLWLKKSFVLDDKSAAFCNDWYPPIEDYIDFGDCNQVKFDLKVWLSGLGLSSTKINFERATQLELADQFEPMNTIPINLNQGGTEPGVFTVEFGRGSATPGADKYPRGPGRVYVYNDDVVAGHLCAVHMEIWAVGQRFRARAGYYTQSPKFEINLGPEPRVGCTADASLATHPASTRSPIRHMVPDLGDRV